MPSRPNVVEVHNATAAAGPLWYRLGQIDGQTNIQWSASHRYDTGFNPSVAVSGSTVVEVHNAGLPNAGRSTALWYRIGDIVDTGIAWRMIPHRDWNNCFGAEACHYDNGFNPKISIAGTAVIEVHNAAAPGAGASGPLWYNFGEANPLPVNPAVPIRIGTVEWNGAIPFRENGFNPSVASFVPSFHLFDEVGAITVHNAQNAAGSLWFRHGPLATRMRTMTVPPDSVNQSNTWADYNPNVGGLCPAGTGLGLPTGNGETAAGFTDIYPEGDTNCRYEELDRGVVHFDLGKFDQLYLARLTFNISRNEQGGGTGRGEPCANIILGMSTSQMNWDFDNAVALPSDCPSPVSLNVTSKVQQWIDTSHANFGFIFAGPRLSLPDDNSNLPTDNDFNHTFYNQFQLFILFNRLLNRRVPP